MDARDYYFMSLAELTSSRSKDPHTKVGSCIAKDKKVLALGYNGAPRNFPDNEVPAGRDRTKPLAEQKYSYILHSEVAAILNYSGQLDDLKGATLYVTLSPCNECAKLIIQCGIKRVVYKEEYKNKEIWDMAKLLFDSCGVVYEKLGGDV